jgi:futalosine hydrolase
MSVLLLATATEMEAGLLRKDIGLEDPLKLSFGEGYLGRFEGLDLAIVHHGIGKVNAAAGLALAVDQVEPRGVIQFGIGGTYLGASLNVGQVAIANREIHLDTGVRGDNGWEDMLSLGLPLSAGNPPLYNEFPIDPYLTSIAAAANGLATVTFGTSETVTGTFKEAAALRTRFGVSIESMEGAAAAQVCHELGVPFAELRGVSNIVGEQKKDAWNIPGAISAVNRATVQALCLLARERS